MHSVSNTGACLAAPCANGEVSVGEIKSDRIIPGTTSADRDRPNRTGVSCSMPPLPHRLSGESITPLAPIQRAGFTRLLSCRRTFLESSSDCHALLLRPGWFSLHHSWSFAFRVCSQMSISAIQVSAVQHIVFSLHRPHKSVPFFPGG